MNRWVEDEGFAHVLDTQLVSPEYSVAEATTGTTSGGIVLETGLPTMVAGPEHFYGNWLGFTCAGAPIHHPITRRLIGSVNLTVRFSDTSPVLVSWVTDVAIEIERALLETASQRERVLLDAFLGAHRDPRHPVLCLDDQTVITNAPASRMLSATDKAMLWEHASRRLTTPAPPVTNVPLENGRLLGVDVLPVSDAGRAVGALIKLKEVHTHAPRTGDSPVLQPSDSLPGLVGFTPGWRSMCVDVQSSRCGAMLLMGDPGVGKYSVASAIASEHATVLDASEFADRASEWLDRIGEARTHDLILRRIDLLDADAAEATIRLLDQRPKHGCQSTVFATATNAAGGAESLFDWFDTQFEVPNLAQRGEDLRLLLDALTRRYVSTVRAVRWNPDVVQTLSRLDWPRNVASLDTFVREVLQTIHKPVVEVGDIPAHLRVRASRRALIGLEQVEAKAILQAMREAKGNKSIAADSLGIARSTLYRKIRSLGIDLTITNY
ncbi:Fis family transcriptional regulator [Rhodococcus fascians]|nr:Fis family transcriptional regulator [Rhodococcus fascians]MBY4237933.1 Fis family transcriptional regulator [Rhodococcus fascians]MBY4253316.1 Fis family transcriptional regulator [Rhodococcus fascians]MBY4268953.1 Fis family transcriptional regulator [Rhodococcus fascians]